MSEFANEYEEKMEPVAEQTAAPEEPVVPAEEPALMQKLLKKKPSKKLLIILAAALVAIVVLVIVLMPSKFDKVKNECVHIAGQISSGKNYFMIDTYPDSYENMSDTMKALMLPTAQKNALKAIKYANEELGFDGSVYSRMLKTSALMGRQVEENSKYKISWTYHPDNGLEVTYQKK